MTDEERRREGPDENRRQLLRRLGLGAAAVSLAYASPVLLDLSEAGASRGSWGSRGRKGKHGSRSKHYRFHPSHRSRRSYGSGGHRWVRRQRRRRNPYDWHLWIDITGGY